MRCNRDERVESALGERGPAVLRANQVDRRHVAIGELRTREDEGEVYDGNLEASEAGGSADGQRETSSRKGKESTMECSWGQQQTKRTKAVTIAAPAIDLRDGRHYTNEQLHCVLDVSILEAVWGEAPHLSPESATQTRAYDVKFIQAIFCDNPVAMKILNEMVRDQIMPPVASRWAFWQNGPDASTRRKTSIMSLIDLALKIPRATVLDEQDIRSVWAAAVRTSLPPHQETGSDITLYVTGNSHKAKRFGQCVLEIEKDDLDFRAGCLHKDHIKTPGEISQQIMALLSATWTTEEDVSRIKFHYGLVSKWTAQCFQVSILRMEDTIWFVQAAGQRFDIGPTARGIGELLRFGEYLNTEVLQACRFVNELLGRARGPNMDIVRALPTLQPASLVSRVSTAPFTPARKSL
ncbi:hypothetical protein DFS34DRAFT_650656 [Phlyctochytrium arcticum]|nr:hypothetical protein DFS34DRAFT_650656 [Phlyctochytrium arcticum]